MGDCELCGATKVATRTAMHARSSIEACSKCMEKMGLTPSVAGNVQSKSTGNRSPSSISRNRPPTNASKGRGTTHRSNEELTTNYASLIRKAREEKGWDQRELAKRMAERVNIIQRTEGGKRPTDDVIKKFERILGIKLMITREISEETHVKRSVDRPMTMADLYEQAKKELRGD